MERQCQISRIELILNKVKYGSLERLPDSGFQTITNEFQPMGAQIRQRLLLGFMALFGWERVKKFVLEIGRCCKICLTFHELLIWQNVHASKVATGNCAIKCKFQITFLHIKRQYVTNQMRRQGKLNIWDDTRERWNTCDKTHMHTDTIRYDTPSRNPSCKR